MTVTVRYFAAAREIVGQEAEAVRLTGEPTVRGLAQTLAAVRPELASLIAASRFALNEEYAPRDASLAEGDQVALIPPVSGG